MAAACDWVLPSRLGVVILLSGPYATTHAAPESTTASARTIIRAIGPRLRRRVCRVPGGAAIGPVSPRRAVAA